jgi:1-acyl-sn-glycerol-3-phosphate acyltransferase
MLEKAYDRISTYLRQGEIVCIFPEGAITRDGEIGSFRPGIEKILARDPVPVVPMALRGLWGSFFSRKGDPARRRWPRRLWSRIALAVGAPVPPQEVTRADLQYRVVALRGDWK